MIEDKSKERYRLLFPLFLELTQSSCTVGDETLKLLQVLKQEKLSSGQIFAAGNSLQKAIKSLTRQAEVKSFNALIGGNVSHVLHSVVT